MTPTTPMTPVVIDGAWLLRMARPTTTRERIGIETDVLAQIVTDICRDAFGHEHVGTIHWFDSSRATLPFFDLHAALLDDERFVLHLGNMRMRANTWVQKQVDTSITTHLSTLAWWGNRAAIILGADEDLAPGVLAARSAGMDVHLASVRSHHCLLDVADSVLGRSASSCSTIDLALARNAFPVHASRAGAHLLSIARDTVETAQNVA